MYILQEGKVYTKVGDKLVGVDFSLDRVSILEAYTTELGTKYMACSRDELIAKLGITETESYVFPRPPVKRIKKEVGEVKNDSVRKTEGTATRSPKRGRPTGTVSGNGKRHNNRTKAQ